MIGSSSFHAWSSQQPCWSAEEQVTGAQVFKGRDLEGPVDYKGPRDADGIVSYLRKQAGPAYIVLKGDKEVCRGLTCIANIPSSQQQLLLGGSE